MYMPKLAQQLSENNKETHYSILAFLIQQHLNK